MLDDEHWNLIDTIFHQISLLYESEFQNFIFFKKSCHVLERYLLIEFSQVCFHLLSFTSVFSLKFIEKAIKPLNWERTFTLHSAPYAIPTQLQKASMPSDALEKLHFTD